MFKHFLVVAAAFLLVASVISAETNAPLLPTQSGAQPPAISTPAKLVEASAVDMETGSDEDFEALADMHDEEVEDADAEEDSDLDGVSAARFCILPSKKLYCLNFASDVSDEDLEDEFINGRIHGQYCGAGYVLTCPLFKVFFIIMHLKSIQ